MGDRAVLRARIDPGAAERLGLVWVKNKGYPWWPARMVPAAYLGKVNPACKRPSGKDAELCQAYQYFGTLEYQWIPPKCARYPVQTFAEGWAQGHWAWSKRRPLMAGIGQACSLLIRETTPPGFFDYVAPPTPEPPAKHQEPPKDRELKERERSEKLKAKAKAKQAALKAKAKAKQAALKAKAKAKAEAEARKAEVKANALMLKVEAREAKKSASAGGGAEARDDAGAVSPLKQKKMAKWPGLTALTEYPKTPAFAPEGGFETTLFASVRGAQGRQASRYTTLQRCQWVCQRPPRPFPRDEVEACACVPTDAMRAAASRRGRRAAAAASRKEAKASADASSAAGGSVSAEAEVRASKRNRTGGARVGCGSECFNRASFTTATGVPVRRGVQQPPVPPARVAQDEDRPHRAPWLGFVPGGARRRRALRGGVHGRDHRRRDHGGAAVGGQGARGG